MPGKDSLDVMVARIDENVMHLKETADAHKVALDKHVEQDEKIANEYIKPLWEAHQRSLGASKLMSLKGRLLERVFTITASVATTIAIVKGMKP